VKPETEIKNIFETSKNEVFVRIAMSPIISAKWILIMSMAKRNIILPDMQTQQLVLKQLKKK